MSVSERIAIALKADLLIALYLMFSIGNLARQRFFNPTDIDGSGLTSGTDRARALQAILQKTLEQAVLALFAHLIWVVVMPVSWLGVAPVAASLFCCGRIAFARGYARGAPARALGFALTFYPSVLMLMVAVGRVLLEAIG